MLGVWLIDLKSLTETAHPVGEGKNEGFSHDKVSVGASALPVDAGGGRYHVQWDDSAPVTPPGQLVFFAQFLHAGGRGFCHDARRFLGGSNFKREEQIEGARNYAAAGVDSGVGEVWSWYGLGMVARRVAR